MSKKNGNWTLAELWGRKYVSKSWNCWCEFRYNFAQLCPADTDMIAQQYVAIILSLCILKYYIVHHIMIFVFLTGFSLIYIHRCLHSEPFCCILLYFSAFFGKFFDHSPLFPISKFINKAQKFHHIIMAFS